LHSDCAVFMQRLYSDGAAQAQCLRSVHEAIAQRFRRMLRFDFKALAQRLRSVYAAIMQRLYSKGVAKAQFCCLPETFSNDCRFVTILSIASTCGYIYRLKSMLNHSVSSGFGRSKYHGLLSFPLRYSMLRLHALQLEYHSFVDS
jgi:hypothetical protein